MARAYTVTLKSKQLKVTDSELSKFADLHGIEGELKSRVSELFLLDLFVYAMELGIGPSDIVEEIFTLETMDNSSSTKPATAFSRPPLHGLWHKHFFCHHFLVQNMRNALNGDKLKALIDQIMDHSKPVVTPEMISEIAHRVTIEPIENRAKDKRLTGEWIIFAKHHGKNYYLCLNTHNAGDQLIADRIRTNCVREFRYLKDILISALSNATNYTMFTYGLCQLLADNCKDSKRNVWDSLSSKGLSIEG